MEFNQEVHIKLNEILLKNNFKIIEESKNYLKFESPHLMIIIVYNPYEKTSNLYFVTSFPNSKTIEIDNESLRDFFKSNLRLSSSNTESFINTLSVFFEREAKLLLQGDSQKIMQLEKYSISRDRIYTDKFKK